MLLNYLPILVLFGAALVIALLLLGLSRALGPFRPNKNKLDPYESGMDPVGEARERYSISFYLVAMEFIVFDLEVVFVYPWAVKYLEMGTGTFIAMMVFIAILFAGLFFTLRKGTLDWDTKRKIIN
jgi:NADH-quinone oxidoreductase subunit A